MANYVMTEEEHEQYIETMEYVVTLENLLSKCYDELNRHDNDSTYNTDPVLMEWIRTTIEVRDLFGGGK